MLAGRNGTRPVIALLGATMQKESYIFAGEYPTKLLQAPEVLRDGRLFPYHVILQPTAHCNAACSWCSLKAADRTPELTDDELWAIVGRFASLGTRAISFSGGEPTLHPGLLSLIDKIGHEYNIRMGLVTNGIRWSQHDITLTAANNYLDWCRVSVADIPDAAGRYCDIINELSSKLPDVDMGVSVVLDNEHDMATLAQLCIACETIDNISHVRVRPNMLDPNAALFAAAQIQCECLSNKLVWHNPQTSAPTCQVCRLAQIRPVVDADGWVYPCCGAQCATDDIGRMPEAFRLCRWDEYDNNVFDPAPCRLCFYDSHNHMLEQYSKPITHGDFL